MANPDANTPRHSGLVPEQAKSQSESTTRSLEGQEQEEPTEQLCRVLIVDDQEFSAQMLQFQLQYFGIQSDIAIGGLDAIEMVR